MLLVQPPERIHETLLSLGRTDKADKPYLIGVFGQGGSSTYAASQYSLVVSRRPTQFLDGKLDGIGWTIVKKIIPKGRRDPYYAYLASLPDGRVPSIAIKDDTAKDFEPGTLSGTLGTTSGGREAQSHAPCFTHSITSCSTRCCPTTSMR
jgi:hypothetical protein